MQKIINAIQSGDITNNKLLQELTVYNDKVVDEFNEVMKALEDRNTSLEDQTHVLKKQHEALVKQDSDKKIFVANEESLKKQSVAFQLENKGLKHQIAVLKKEAKAQREQVKRNQAANKAKDAKIKRLGKQQGGDDSKLQPLTTVYSNESEVLLIWPSQLELGVNGKKSKQTVLLFTDREGCYVTCFLDENQEVGFTTPIKNDAVISDQTRKLIQKNCMNMSDECAEFAQAWLYRLNIIQKGVIKPVDMTCFRG